MLPEQKINSGNSAVSDDETVETIQVNDDDEVEVEDSTADVNVAAKLPPHGIYTVKVKPPKDDEKIYKSKTKSDSPRAFVGVNGISVTIQDEEWEGSMAFVNHINSLQRRGKPSSELHHLLNLAGNPAPNRTTVGELETHVRATLEEEPVVYAELDWKASYKNDKGEYLDVKTTMEAFPKHYVDGNGETVASAKDGKWDGTYRQQIPNPSTGEDIEAQLYVRKFLTQSEASKMKAKMRTA